MSVRQSVPVLAEVGTAGVHAGLFYRIEPYLYVLPGLILLLVFRYVPMVGLQIAFRDYMGVRGFFGSEWVGLRHFQRFVESPMFGRVVFNTLRVTFLTLIFSFPWPIIFALGLNEIDSRSVKQFYQTISWAPHFVSVVVVVSMVFLFTSPSTGMVNAITRRIGIGTINFMMEPRWFVPLYVISDIWQSIGWGTVIYLATLSNVSPELHESAIIDGASRFQRVVRINLPFLIPIIVIQLIIQSGRMLDVGFEKVFLMQTALNQSAAEVLSTYTYRTGIMGGQYSFATAVGLFRSVISLTLIVTVNKIARRLGETALW